MFLTLALAIDLERLGLPMRHSHRKTKSFMHTDTDQLDRHDAPFYIYCIARVLLSLRKFE